MHGSFQCCRTKASREVFLPLNHVFHITPHVRYSSTPAYSVAKQRKRLMQTISLLINATNSNYKKTDLVKFFFCIGNIAFNFTSNSLQSITTSVTDTIDLIENLKQELTDMRSGDCAFLNMLATTNKMMEYHDVNNWDVPSLPSRSRNLPGRFEGSIFTCTLGKSTRVRSDSQ